MYEEEGDLFFEDLSNSLIQDDVFSRLLTFPNVVITGHQAFFTREALEQANLACRRFAEPPGQVASGMALYSATFDSRARESTL